MKNRYNFALLAMFLVVLASCNRRQVSMQTVINEDGSCVRTFNICLDRNNQTDNDQRAEGDVDFAFFVDSATMVFDANWKKTWSPKQTDQTNAFPIKEATLKQLDKQMKAKHQTGFALDTIRVDVQQEFASVEDMCKSMPLKYNGKNLNVKGELKKSFKWFYTDYTYTETYAAITDEFTVAPTVYMTEDEAGYWFAGVPDLTKGMKGNEAKGMLDGIELKVDKWFVANYMSDLVDFIAKHYDELENAPLSKKEFVEQRDSLAKYAAEQSYEIWEGEGFDKKMLNAFFKTEVYSNLLDKEEMQQEVQTYMLLKYGEFPSNNIDYSLNLPGEIISSSEGVFKYGVAQFRFSIEKLVSRDYTISATSRVKNTWAYVVSILVILLAIGSFFYKRKG